MCVSIDPLHPNYLSIFYLLIVFINCLIDFLVALLIILCAGGTFQQPRMIGKREDFQTRPNADYEYVDSNLDDQLNRLGQYDLKGWDATPDEGGKLSSSLSLSFILIAKLYRISAGYAMRFNDSHDQL